MLIAKIAFRNIFRQRRRSFLTALTMVGGFFLLSVAISISNGTYDRVINLFTRAYTGHVQVHRSGYPERPNIHKNFDDIDRITKLIKSNPDVVALTLRIYSPVMSFIGKKTTVARLVGLNPEMESLATGIETRVGEGRFIAGGTSKEIVLGGGLAEILKAKVGDEIVLIGQGADGSIANDRFKIVGIMKGSRGSSGRFDCYMNSSVAQEFLSLKNVYHEIAVILEDYRLSRETASDIAGKLGEGYDVKPWEEIQKQFYSAMKADRRGMWIALTIIIIVVGIGVLNTVLMSILERTKEFGILRALGTRPGSIFKMIVLETVFLALFAVFAGTIAAYAANYALSVYGWDYPQSVEMGGFVITTMYGSTEAVVFLYPAVLVVSTAAIVSIFPAIRAMRITPVKALRKGEVA